jgi:hypothetical protein
MWDGSDIFVPLPFSRVAGEEEPLGRRKFRYEGNSKIDVK